MWILPYLILVVSFVALIKGADFFVEGSSSIAKKLRIPDFIVGLTIVAMGTSAPELAASASAALKGQTGMAIGNVVGSNLLNILIILGVSALILPPAVDRILFKRDIPFLLLTAVILPVMLLIGGKDELGLYELNWVSGLILLCLFVLYLFLTVRSALRHRREHPDMEEEEIKVMPWWKSILFTLGGAVLIVLGGNFAVDSATDIAHQLGIPEKVIGLTVVALGTSLPELVTSAVAAKKGNSDIAIGNVVGSNIFNVLLILGVTVTIRPVPADMSTMIDLLVVVGASVLFAVTSFLGKRIRRVEGAAYLTFYAAYLVYKFATL